MPAGDEGLGAGLVGGEKLAVVAHVHGLAVERVDGISEPAVAVAVEQDLLAEFDEWDGSAGVGKGTAEAVSGRAVLHRVACGLHGPVAGGDGGVGVVVMARG